MAVDDSITLALRELVSYDPISGEIRYRRDVGRWGCIKAGTLAGCQTKTGYIQVAYKLKPYLAHRVALMLTHGSWPDGHVDHINGNRADNRLSNLRVVSVAGNIQNQRKANKRNALGLLGVSQQSANKYRAKIKAHGVKYNLGAFDTPEQAHAAYLEAKRRLHSTCSI